MRVKTEDDHDRLSKQAEKTNEELYTIRCETELATISDAIRCRGVHSDFCVYTDVWHIDRLPRI